MPARPAARPQLPPRRQRARVRGRGAARPEAPGVLGHRALEPALARAAGAHADPQARGRRLHAALGRGATRAVARAGPRAPARRALRPAARLRAAVLDRRHLPPAGRPDRPRARPARLVARDGEDVRARHDRSAGRGSHASRRRVPRLRGRPRRGAAAAAAGRPGHPPRRDPDRRQAVERPAARLDDHRAPERRPRGDRQHARQRRAGAAAPPGAVAAARCRSRSSRRRRSRS